MKRVLIFVIALVMVLSLAPAVLAEDAADAVESAVPESAVTE